MTLEQKHLLGDEWVEMDVCVQIGESRYWPVLWQGPAAGGSDLSGSDGGPRSIL